MSKEKEANSGRRSLLTGLGLAAAGAAAGVTSGAIAQEEGAARETMRYPLDAWLDRPDALHRIFIDSSRPLGAAEGLQYAHNMLSAHVSAYAGKESDFALVVCFRRFSTPFGWGDEVWEKYGKILDRVLEFPDPVTNEPFITNPMQMERADLPNRGNTITSIGDRGVKFAVCNAATRTIAGVLSRVTGNDREEIYAELVASLIPNATFVPAGVLTATRAQEYGYSLLSAAGA